MKKMTEAKDIRMTGFENVFKFLKTEKEESLYVVIPLDHLHEFADHPFRVEDNSDEQILGELYQILEETRGEKG